MAVTLDTLIQYQDAPRINAFLDGLQALLNTYNMSDLERTLDLDLASGYQLDYIGKLVGFQRPVSTIDDAMNWDLDNWDEEDWADDGTATVIALSDASYRKLLRAWCAQLFNVITINNIYATLDSAFGEEEWEVVGTVGLITVRIPNTVSANDIELIRSGIIQSPQGVEVEYEILP